MGKQWKQWQTIFLGSKITSDGDCMHEIRYLLRGRKAMTNLDSVLKNRDIILPIKFPLVKAMVFPGAMYGRESWNIKKAERQRLILLDCGVRDDSWESQTARRSNQSILTEINPEYSLEGLMLKLTLQIFGHLMGRVDSLEKTLRLEKTEGRRIRARQRMRQLDGTTDSMDMNLSKLQDMLKYREAWHTAVMSGHDWATNSNKWEALGLPG